MFIIAGPDPAILFGRLEKDGRVAPGHDDMNTHNKSKEAPFPGPPAIRSM